MTPYKGFVLACCLGLLVLLLPIVGQAQQLKLYKQEIRTLYKQGKRLVQRRAYTRALVKFRAALALLKQSINAASTNQQKQSMSKRLAGFYYVIARTHHYNKEPQQAYLHYQLSLASGAKGKTATLAKQHLTTLRDKALLSIGIDSQPSGATLRLVTPAGSSIKSRTPFLQKLPPGTYKLHLYKSTFLQQMHTIVLQPGKPFQQTFALKTALGSVTLLSAPPGASVTLIAKDKQSQGTTPFTRSLPAGQYSGVIKQRGYQNQPFSFQLVPGQSFRQTYALSPIPRPRPIQVVKRPPPRLPTHAKPMPHPRRKMAQIFGWTGLVLGFAVGAGAATMFGLGEHEIQQFNARAGRNENEADAAAIRQHHQHAELFRMIGIIATATAGGLTATAIGLFAWNGGSPPPPPTTNDKRTSLLTTSP